MPGFGSAQYARRAGIRVSSRPAAGGSDGIKRVRAVGESEEQRRQGFGLRAIAFQACKGGPDADRRPTSRVGGGAQ